MRFPSIAGTTVAGDRVRLPDDLPAGRSVVLVAFFIWHQSTVDRWVEELAAWDVALPVFEVPYIGLAWRPVGGWISNGMRSGIPDVATQRRTIVSFGLQRLLAARLGVRGVRRPIAALVRDGEVIGATNEAASASSAATLLAGGAPE